MRSWNYWSELIFTGLFYILIVYGEIVGIYHSFDKHGAIEGFISIGAPPWAWYRSAEIWWHDDFAGINWVDRLKTDTKNCLIMLTEYGYDNSVRINEEIENAKNKYSKYPKDKLLYIKNFCREYVSFYELTNKDSKQFITDFLNTGNFKFVKSKETLLIENQLKKYHIEDLDIALQQADSLLAKYKDVLQNVKNQYDVAPKEEKEKFIELIIINQNKKLSNIKLAFKNLFNEEMTN